MAARPAVVEPELPCADFSVTPSTCTCGLGLKVRNDCLTALEFSNHVFDSCYRDADDAGHPDCTAVGPGEITTLDRLSVHDDGQHVWTLAFTNDGVSYRAKLVADVSDFDGSGCACRLAAPGGRAGTSGYAAAAALLWFAVRRRRNARGPAHRILAHSRHG